MLYKCLALGEYAVLPYRIVPIRPEDMLSIKQWRNEQISILRQNHILTDAEQLTYYHSAILPTFQQDHPAQLLFSILLDKQCIGYGGLTHIDWTSKRAEVSFLLATERNSNIKLFQKEFSIFITFLQQIAFHNLGLNRLYTETYDIRPYLVEILNLHGFKLEGRMRKHVYINGQFVDSLIHGLLREEQEER